MDDRKKGSAAPYIVMLALALAIAALLLYILPYRYRLNQTVYFDESGEELSNPLIGYAPSADETGGHEDANLVYIGLTWAEWESVQGQYDIEALEEKFHIARWKEEGKHAVLRFLCDVPGEAEHLDIPLWLYERTADGSYYNTSYGSGYSPDYSNDFFRERHALAIEALADYFNEDSFLAYVELGSLGHWGEWHTNVEEGAGSMPDADVCWDYVLDYSDNFHNARILMRRNYIMVADAGLGLYNDMTGHKNDTEEWLDWIENGGSYPTENGELEYEPVPDFWKTAPVGGEFTSSLSMEEMLDTELSTTLDLIERSHMSFIGPHCPEGEELKLPGAEAVQALLGYRFYISQLQTQFSFADDQLDVYLTWENTGSAPMYWDWPVMMYVYDMEGELKYWESVDIQLSELMPGEQLVTENHIPFTDLLRQGYQIGIGITDPEEKETVALAMDCERTDEGIHLIYTYEN